MVKKAAETLKILVRQTRKLEEVRTDKTIREGRFDWLKSGLTLLLSFEETLIILFRSSQITTFEF